MTGKVSLGLSFLLGISAYAVQLDLVTTNVVVPAGHSFQLPLTADDGTGGPITYSVVSVSNTKLLKATLSPKTNRSLVLNVSGVDETNAPFSGDLVMHLFEDLTPVTTAHIISLVQSNFYNGLTFHRVIQDFMCQGGDPNGNGTGGSGQTIDDEFSTLLTFTGFGQLAMANSGDDTGDSQFFITDSDLSVTTTNKPSPRWLDFQHTIFGQMTRGFDVLEKLMGTPVISSNNAPITPVIINSASIISNRQDGVLRLSTPRGVTGTVFVTVRALATNRTSATGKIAVNIISNTVNDATFLGPLPHSLITTQIAGAVMAPFRVFDIDGDQPSLALEDLATGQFPTSFSATIDDLNRLWLFPVTGFTGTVNMVLGAKDATHNYDTHKFSVTVLPAPDSPTLYILPRTGMLYAPTNALGSKFNVSGRCVLTNGSDHAFSSNDVVKVTFGGGTNTLNLVLRPDDLALKLRSGILSYRSKVGVKPSIYLNFNSRLGLFNLMLAGFDFSQPQTNDVQVSIQIGNDYGSDTRTWTNRLGKFYPPRP